jgi:serine/threonine-protein kinase
MSEPHDHHRNLDSSVPADSLDAGLAAGFGRPGEGPRSSLEASQRPVVLKEAKGESDHIVKPRSDAMPAPEQAGNRYQLQGEIARGGMGAVLRGRDVDLGRNLAIKVLLEKHARRPEVARRFLEEAQIGGQLQHPGVVPVYDVGRFGERPFFTMKLVKGQTLAALLRERDDPSADRPRLLNVALQVTQALAYAHAKGVIHRDLKPANVMVGAFGEVQVMDWGLAKVLAEGGVADEERAGRQQQPDDGTQVRTVRSSGSGYGTDTEAGSLLGTPAYMPPEQAQGDNAHLDRRCDVFGLGAILCEILTGRPPYVGRSAEEVRRKAANGDLADALAGLDGCGADQELIGLTKACLSAEAIDRPRDAQAVADALTGYLDGVQERLRQAELAQAAALARAAEEAKRRRLTLALAVTVLLAVLTAGGGWLYVQNEREARLAQLTHDVHDALNRATALREQAKAANAGGPALFARAREQVQRALALVENGPADETLRDQVRRLQTELDEEEKDRKLVAALDEALLAMAKFNSRRNRFAEERAVPRFREAFAAYGLPAGRGEAKAAARRIRRRPPAVREAILAALDEWDDLAGIPEFRIDEPHRDWLRAVLEAAEPQDGWTRRFRAAWQEKDVGKRCAALERLATAADVGERPVRALTRLARRLATVQAQASALKLLRLARRHSPADFWVNHDLGIMLAQMKPPRLEQSVRFLTAAVSLRPDSPAEHSNLGVALYYKGQRDEALACFEKAITLDPKLSNAHSNLGLALAGKGQLDRAIACFERAIALDPKYAPAHSNLGLALAGKGQLDRAIACWKKATELDPNYSPAHSNLGNALRRKGRLDEAIACFRKAVALDPNYAEAHGNLGVALHEQGQLDEAIACWKKAIALDPKLALAHSNLGNALLAQGQVDEAIACWKKATELNPRYAAAHSNLGKALVAKGRVDEAIACFRKALALDPNYAEAHSNLGVALHKKGQVDEAIACWKKAIALNPRYAATHSNLGKALADEGRVDEAIACFKKALALDPKLALAHNNLGNLLYGKGQLDRAIACWKKAIALDPKLALAHSNLGNALLAQGQVDEAIECHKKAIALDPKLAAAHVNLGNALVGQGKVDEAIACFRKAIALDPKLAEAHCNLGLALARQGRFAESLAALRRGHELGSKRSGWPYPSAAWLRQAEANVALEAKLPAFLKGEFRPGDNKERLDLAVVCRARKLHHAATGLYAAAFAADPRLADDLQAAHRNNAACCAALAAAGKGKDAGKLDDKERARLRKRALDWLEADLTAWGKLLDSGPPQVRPFLVLTLSLWQKAPDLTGIRDRAALAQLPAQEQKAFAQLWADVAALLKKAETPTDKESRK